MARVHSCVCVCGFPYVQSVRVSVETYVTYDVEDRGTYVFNKGEIKRQKIQIEKCGEFEFYANAKSVRSIVLF